MVTISKSSSVIQIILIFSITSGNRISHHNTTDNLQLLPPFVQIGKSDLHLQNLFKKPKPALTNGTATRRTRKDEKSIFTCVCTSPKELNATLVVPWPANTGSWDINGNDPMSWTGAFAYFKILQCQKSNIICRKWKSAQTLSTSTNRICQDYMIKKEANITEVRTRSSSCIITANGNLLGRVENIDKKRGSKNRSKIAIVLYQNSTLPLSNDSKILRMGVPKSRSLVEQQTHLSGRFQTLRIRRSTTISLKPMIFPYLSRNLVERKRNMSKEIGVEADIGIRKGEMVENVMRIGTQNASMHHQEIDSVPETSHDYIRRKREMHVIMTRYRKRIKRSRKKRPKTTSSSSYFDHNDDCGHPVKKVNTTPYTFLNVSFTGYWEREEKTTVKPRIQRPLKTSEYDLNWVYGGSGYEKGRDRGRNKKGNSGGWSSKLHIQIQH